ncbi:putative ATP-dependent RNA helicase DHX33-like protein, partial [Dinothrombium tinctorium]
IYNSVKTQEDYVNSALITVFQIHQSQPEGDILVFCTGQEEIESMVTLTKDTIKHLPAGSQKLTVLPLYSALPSHLQLRIFDKSIGRKVIFATNIAETSITIPGVKYVIDTGKVKSRIYKPGEGFEMLRVMTISKAQATQRAGRAGRESSGVCYRLYTEDEYKKMDDHTVPEILRCNLSSVILHCTALGIKNCLEFDFIDKPSTDSLRSGLSFLQELGAIEKINEYHFELTKLGKQMVSFPLDPQFSKIIVMSSELKCTEEILTILSMLYVERIFFIPPNKKEIASEIHKKFISGEGDHIMLLKIYRAYKSANCNPQWCQENFINHREMKTVIQVRQQLSTLCQKLSINKQSCGQNTDVIRKCLFHGLFRNVAVLQKDATYKALATKQEVSIHPSSCLFNSKPEYVIYTDLIQTSKCYMRNISVIDAEWIMNAKQHMKVNETNYIQMQSNK